MKKINVFFSKNIITLFIFSIISIISFVGIFYNLATVAGIIIGIAIVSLIDLVFLKFKLKRTPTLIDIKSKHLPFLIQVILFLFLYKLYSL
jgi:ABC-type bacteriocin/lantibiotic exporter with double-glycine peptidase domain